MGLKGQEDKVKKAIEKKVAERNLIEQTASANGWVNKNPDVIAGWNYIMKIPLTVLSGRSPNMFLADADKEKVWSQFYEYTSAPKDVQQRVYSLVSQYGWHPNEIFMNSGLKRKDNSFLESVGKVAVDVAKGVSYVAAAPVNSITGHVYDPGLETKLGGVLGGTAIIGTDSVNLMAKTFVDTVSFGGGSKLANVIRKDENKESAGNYMESKSKTDEVSSLKAFEKVSKGGAAIIGSYFGAKALESSDLAKNINQVGQLLDVAQGGFTDVSSEPYVDPSTQGDSTFMLILFGIVGAILILK